MLARLQDLNFVDLVSSIMTTNTCIRERDMTNCRGAAGRPLI
jgi:hypothetical protein